MAQTIDREELRLLIREALREALGATPPVPSGQGGARNAVDGADAGRSGRSHAAPASESGAAGAPYRLDSGLLTETAVARIAGGHKRILVGAEVVVTPLARDRARVLKVEIVRQKP